MNRKYTDMNNIIRKIREYYPVSDDSLNILKSNFEEQVFPARTIIIGAGYWDKNVFLIENGITRSYIL